MKPVGGGGNEANPLLKDGGGSGGGGGGGRGKDSPPDRGGVGLGNLPRSSFLAIPTLDGNVGGGGNVDFLPGLLPPPLLLLLDSPASTAGGIMTSFLSAYPRRRE
jgi:hypothetical protein